MQKESITENNIADMINAFSPPRETTLAIAFITNDDFPAWLKWTMLIGGTL